MSPAPKPESILPAKYRKELHPAPVRRTRRQRVLALCKQPRTAMELHELIGGNFGALMGLLASMAGDLVKEGKGKDCTYRRRDETQ
jgi:hypothetical protein